MSATLRIGVCVTCLLIPAAVWSQDFTRAPEGRGAAAVVWDANREALVVYGGIGASSGAFADLWEYTTSGWQRRYAPSRASRSPAPSPRFNVSAAFHAPTRRFVMHGGGDIGGATGDTWGWDGHAWKLLARPTAGPSARTCARMVARSREGDLLLIGGQAVSGEIHAETWSWNGAAWKRLDLPGTPATCFHNVAYDEARGNVVLFGGRGTGAETWILDSAGWRRADAAGPPARDHHAMGWDPISRRVIVHGGGGQRDDGKWDRTILSDTWAWNGAAWTQLPRSGPARMHVPGMATAPALGGLVMFGGSDTTASHADLYRFDGARWHLMNVTAGSTEAASGHVCCGPDQYFPHVTGGIMSELRDRTVSQRPDGQWANKRDGTEHATSLHATQQEAVDAARQQLARDGGGELKIKGEDGRIREKDSVRPARE